ncbi:hypothetical protein [Pseudonocardia sp.]|uniref:hypothetical protein n=1 Tax=Pseudonocardia sp. TaxID=60912 RepID=UPI00262B712F|nr:hypothetical protein [Pseudonocardia sp.]
MTDLLEHLDAIPEYREPAPYWRTRHALAGVQRAPEPKDPRLDFAELIVGLESAGYLARRFGEVCVDAEPDEHGQLPHGGKDSHDRIRAELQQRLGLPDRPDLWPPAWDRWDAETFYEVIEVFHDLVARPHRRWIHDHNECGVHFDDFDTEAGRRVYRALVNRLLTEGKVDLRLAEAGEDTGRLVHLVDDARSDLLERALATPDPEVAGRVEHAIALFRGRDATEHDKRSAVMTLIE